MNQQGSCAVLDPSLAPGQELQDYVCRLDGFVRYSPSPALCGEPACWAEQVFPSGGAGSCAGGCGCKGRNNLTRRQGINRDTSLRRALAKSLHGMWAHLLPNLLLNKNPPLHFHLISYLSSTLMSLKVSWEPWNMLLQGSSLAFVLSVSTTRFYSNLSRSPSSTLASCYLCLWTAWSLVLWSDQNKAEKICFFSWLPPVLGSLWWGCCLSFMTWFFFFMLEWMLNSLNLMKSEKFSKDGHVVLLPSIISPFPHPLGSNIAWFGRNREFPKPFTRALAWRQEHEQPEDFNHILFSPWLGLKTQMNYVCECDQKKNRKYCIEHMDLKRGSFSCELHGPKGSRLKSSHWF